MKKRILAVLLVLALVIVAGTVAVSAAAGNTKSAPAANGCPVHENCTAQWTEWTYGAGDKVVEGGHYYLNAAIEGMSSQIGIGDAENAVDVVLDLRGYNVTSSVRAFYVYPGSIFTLMDSTETPGTVSGGNNGATGSLIYIDTGTSGAKTTLNLYDVTLTSNSTATTQKGGTIYSSNYGVINIHGATINAGKAELGGGIYMSSYCEINMDSGLITGGYAGRGGNIWLGASTINISGGTISGGEANKAADSASSPSFGGGNIMMGSGSSKLNVSGTALITGGTNVASTKDANRGGGNIYLQGTMTMTGGTISDGTTNASGGNILVRGTFNMSAGTISGGSAMTESASGGGGALAIRNKDGIVNISGGNITGGTVSVVRSDSPNGSFTLSGDPVIDELVIANNTTGYTLAIGEGGLTDGAKIGIKVNDGQEIFADGVSADIAQYLSPVADGRNSITVDSATGAVTIAENTWCEHCKANVTWEELPALVSGYNDFVGGDTEDVHYHYYLNDDRSFAGRIRPTYATNATTYGHLCFDLNGHTITSTNNHVFWVRGGDLAIMDSAVGGMVVGNGTAAGGVIYDVTANCQIDIYGGTLKYASATGVNTGGIIHAAAEGTVLNIHGGHLIGGKTKAAGTLGGSINISGKSTNKAQLNITGGVIEGGYATTNGGNIYIAAGVIANISGGTITGGHAKNNGGNICVASGTSLELNISGDAIIENGVSEWKSTATTAYGGGNIYTQGKTTISGNAIIRNGTAYGSGGNLFVRYDTSITGGRILGGSAASHGNSIGMRDALTIGGTAYIDGEVEPLLEAWTSLTLTGTPTIKELKLNGYEKSDGTAYQPVADISKLTGGDITVSADADVAFTVASDNAEAIKTAGYIKSGVEGCEVGVAQNCLLLKLPAKVAVCEKCGGAAVEWIEINEATLETVGSYKGYKNGHYYLADDYSNPTRIVLMAQTESGNDFDTSKICLDLNGHTYTKTGNAQAFWVRPDTELSIMDMTHTDGKLTDSFSSTAATAYGSTAYMTGGTFNLCSGTLEYTGTGVRRGGVIGANSALVEINITGGTITGGKAWQDGGNIYVSNNASQLNISGDALITGGSVVSAEESIPVGGNIACLGKFTMTGGTVTDGTIQSTVGNIPRGGNIYMAGSTNNHVISGGTVSDGVSILGNGGNVYVGYGTLTVSGSAKITNGESQRGLALNNGGGNLYLYSGALNIKEGAVISGGKAVSVGGNISANGVLNIESKSCVVDGQSETGFGEEVFGNTNAEITIDDLGDAWSGKIAMVENVSLTEDPVVGARLARYYNSRVWEIWYASVEDVIAADDADIADDPATEDFDETMISHIKLFADGLTFDHEGIYNLNGHDATFTAAATCYDSATVNYSDAYCGTATMAVAPATTVVAPNGYLYITVEEADGQYSFHRLNMDFERLSIRPRSAGIYYSSSWNADNTLAGTLNGMEYEAYPIITGYGMALKKGSAADGESFTNGDKFAYTYFDNINGETNEYLCNNKGAEINSCLLSNIINETNGTDVNQANAEVMIYATPYVEITNSNGETEYVMGPTYGNSLKGIVEWVVSEIDAMEETDRTKNIGFITPLDEFAQDCGLVDYFTGLAALING